MCGDLMAVTMQALYVQKGDILFHLKKRQVRHVARILIIKYSKMPFSCSQIKLAAQKGCFKRDKMIKHSQP